MILLQFAILIYSIILHEIAHGWVANYLGDPTARLMGRLTLDPRPHIDPIMTLGLPFLLILTGSPVIFGAAKPVPVDAFNFREPKKDIALVSAAGPITNLLIALIFTLLARFMPLEIFFYGMQINVFLAVFNLLPIPPLDGFKVVGGLLPDEYARTWFSFEKFGVWGLFIILFMFPGVINTFILPISESLIKLLLLIP